MRALASFVNELRRRHVFRVAGLYIVAAWVVLQVADLALEMGPREPYPLAASALLHAMTSETAKAVAISRGALAQDLEDRWGSHHIFLRQLADDGWRTLWCFNTVMNPSHDSLRDPPGYQAILQFIEDDLQHQVDEAVAKKGPLAGPKQEVPGFNLFACPASAAG